jgi:hypothetical protein
MRRPALLLASLMVVAHVWFAIAIVRQHFETDFDIEGHVALGLWFNLVVWRGWRWGVPIAGAAAILWLADQQPPRRGLERGLAALLVITALATGFVAYFE